MLRFSSAGRTHTGLVRDHNEDSAFAGPYLQVVADGVGGAAAGEVASATSAYVVSALAGGSRGGDPVDVLRRGVEIAHQQLRLGIAADPSRAGMSTTLTALLIDGDRCALAHVGDSRAYRWRDGALVQLTRDHTYVQTLVDAGTITRAEARHHPRKNVVLNALEASAPTSPDVTSVELLVGDRYLVCSDGLSDLVDEEEIAACLRSADPERAAQRLMHAALEAGGTDNVTVLVADVEDGARLVPDGKMFGALGDLDLIVDPAAVRSGV
jgi:protein phosphatase